MKTYKTLIIDDEPLARSIIEAYLKDDDSIEIIGQCENGFEGYKLINELRPDLVFLDIMMPKLTGFEMLELVTNPPAIIFSTAYDEFAIKAFEQNAVDYLLKPYAEDRFKEALEKAKNRVNTKTEQVDFEKLLVENQKNTPNLTRIAVKTGSKIQIIATASIHYIEAMDDYVKIYSDEGSFLKQNTMKYYEKHLSQSEFVRIHRSYIVKVKNIARLELLGKDSHVVILTNNTQLPVSRTGYGKLKKELGF